LDLFFQNFSPFPRGRLRGGWIKKTMKFFNKKEQKIIRQNLRNQRSKSEKILWYKIRNQQLGVKFRRQHGIGNYVVDFYCPEIGLIVEIDGATHGGQNEVKYDNIRQKYLKNKGLKVKRYRNVDVKNNLEGILEDLIEFIEKNR